MTRVASAVGLRKAVGLPFHPVLQVILPGEEVSVVSTTMPLGIVAESLNVMGFHDGK